jgi:hypothetical protein
MKSWWLPLLVFLWVLAVVYLYKPEGFTALLYNNGINPLTGGSDGLGYGIKTPLLAPNGIDPWDGGVGNGYKSMVRRMVSGQVLNPGVEGFQDGSLATGTPQRGVTPLAEGTHSTASLWNGITPLGAPLREGTCRIFSLHSFFL